MSRWRTKFQNINIISRATTTTTAAYLVVAMLTLCSLCAGSPCQSTEWWNSIKHKCIPCTICADQEVKFRPCDLQWDTVCRPIVDLQLDWEKLAKTEPNWKERRKEKLIQMIEDESYVDNQIDWQTTSLILAVILCLVFVVVAACVLIQHMRQWRRMECRLDRDVEELSAKLMARLAEVQKVDSGTFLIENPIKYQSARPVEVQCVYLDHLLAGNKGSGSVKSIQRGNVYIEACPKG